ncbi:MAG: hypothetical protein ACKV2V_18300 [Blastocatellia bacterium]
MAAVDLLFIIVWRFSAERDRRGTVAVERSPVCEIIFFNKDRAMVGHANGSPITARLPQAARK